MTPNELIKAVANLKNRKFACGKWKIGNCLCPLSALHKSLTGSRIMMGELREFEVKDIIAANGVFSTLMVPHHKLIEVIEHYDDSEEKKTVLTKKKAVEAFELAVLRVAKSREEWQ